MNRRTQIILGIVILIALGVGIYFLFFTPKDGGLSVNPGGLLPGSGDALPNVDGSQGQLGQGDTASDAGAVVANRLVRITSGPVSYGTVSLFRPSVRATTTTIDGFATSTLTREDVEVRYIERMSGNVYAYTVHERVLKRITNQTIPGIVEAAWTDDGQNVFARFLNAQKSIETYSLNVETGDGYFLEPNLPVVALNGGNSLFTLVSNENGSTGSLSTISGENVRTAFSSTLASINVQFAGSSLFATTKPSGQLDGYGFTINTTSGLFTRVLGPTRGLSTLPSPTGKYVLHSGFTAGTLSLGFIDPSTKENIVLPLLTLAEKCVWTKDEAALYCAAPRALPKGLPDSWYQGVSSFNDRIWKIDLVSRVAVLVFDPSDLADIQIDAIELTLDSENDTLTFTNKTDGALYVYDL
jgi:hypothetical protein